MSHGGHGGHGHGSGGKGYTPTMKVTPEQLQKFQVPIAYRDYCAHLLIRLNKCREKSFYMPWKCEHERHSYESCQYQEYKRRKQLYREQRNGGQ